MCILTVETEWKRRRAWLKMLERRELRRQNIGSPRVSFSLKLMVRHQSALNGPLNLIIMKVTMYTSSSYSMV